MAAELVLIGDWYANGTRGKLLNYAVNIWKNYRTPFNVPNELIDKELEMAIRNRDKVLAVVERRK